MNMSFVPPAADFAPISSLLAVISAPEAAKARLDQIAAPTAEVRATLGSIRAEQAALDRARKETGSIVEDLKAKRAQHERDLADATARKETEWSAREVKLKDWERSLLKREAELSEDRKAVEQMRASLEQKLEALKAITTA